MASITVNISFNGAIWVPIALMIFAYVTVTSTIRFGWSKNYNRVLSECNELNKKIRLEEPLSLLEDAKRNAGIIGTLTLTLQSRQFISKAESVKLAIEEKYGMVLDKRNELFNVVSMLKERGLDYINAEETLTEVQRQLTALRPDNYSGLEMPDAEKFENKSISDLEEIQEATVVEILEENEK